jgi:glycosyl transferase family 4
MLELYMRILHLSDTTLPDWRIEKSAMTGLKAGHQVFFGGGSSMYHAGNVFSEIYSIDWSPRARLGMPIYWGSVRKQFSRVIKETRPDIIHAHNIFSAKMASEFGISLIYDDHEYWSEYSKVLLEEYVNNEFFKHRRGKLPSNFARKTITKLLRKRSVGTWSAWEKEIVSSHPTITVSKKISDELKSKYSRTRVFVVPNFPMDEEVRNFRRPVFFRALSSVYLGIEPDAGPTLAHRNITGLENVFLKNDVGRITFLGKQALSSNDQVKYMGFLPRQDMYREMFNHSIGLIPWKQHWSHAFVSPNKAYEYAHAGLAIVCTSSFAVIKEILGEHCITFEDYEDMASKLKYFKENLDELYKRRLRIFDFARDNLIWEKNEKSILAAYDLC